MKTIRFEEATVIRRSPEVIFDLTQDYDRRLMWDSFLKRAELMEGASRAGKGVKTYCVAQNGIGMVTEYVSFQRPKVTAIKMTEGPYMFRSFLGTWRFRKINEKGTEVRFLYSFTLRFPFNFTIWLVKWILRREVKGRLRDLKRYLEEEE